MLGCYNSWYFVSSDTKELPFNFFLSVLLFPKLAKIDPFAPLNGLYVATFLFCFSF
jgi:hypothetical protein